MPDQPMTRSDFRFFHPYRVRYSDLDPQRVVYFAQVFVIANAAMHEYFEWLDFPYIVSGWQRSDTDFHFAHVDADYRRSIEYDERLEIGVRTARLGNSSLSLALGFFRTGEDDAAVEVTFVLVNFDQESHASARLPDEFAAAIEAKEGVARAG